MSQINKITYYQCYLAIIMYWKHTILGETKLASWPSGQYTCQWNAATLWEPLSSPGMAIWQCTSSQEVLQEDMCVHPRDQQWLHPVTWEWVLSCTVHYRHGKNVSGQSQQRLHSSYVYNALNWLWLRSLQLFWLAESLAMQAHHHHFPFSRCGIQRAKSCCSGTQVLTKQWQEPGF